MTKQFIITLSCPDRPGIVAGVTTSIYRNGGNILEASQFEDIETARFLMRVVFSLPEEREGTLARSFERISEKLDLTRSAV